MRKLAAAAIFLALSCQLAMAEYFADLSGFNERVRKIINAVEGR